MWFGTDRILRVVLRATSATDQQVTTLHYVFQDTDTSAVNEPQPLADAIAAAVLPSYRALYISSWTIQPVEVVDELDPLDPPAARSAWTSGVAAAGTLAATSDYLPAACCLIASLQTDQIGRRHRGRIFVGGSWGEIDQTNGLWNATAIARAKTFTDAIPHTPVAAAAGSTSTCRWVVYSRTARRLADADYYAPVQTVVHKSPVHWLRSRQP